MDNETILSNRWDHTNEKLREHLSKSVKLNKKTQDEIQNIFNDMDINFNDLDKPISLSKRQKLYRKADEWRDKGLLTGYFEYKVNNLLSKRIITYNELLEILLWGAFIEERNKLYEYEKYLFNDIGQDLYKQAINEIKPSKKKKWNLTWEFIWSLLCLPNIKGDKWTTYIEALALTNSQEVKRQAIIQLQQNVKPNVDSYLFKNIFKKQLNRYLCIDNEKISGSLDLQVREVGNKCFLKAGEDTGTKKCRFISDLCPNVTLMCKNMNNYLFSINGKNTFDRYMGETSKDLELVRISVNGLQSGINLPPIVHHFHYCHSTITYQLSIDIANDIRSKIKNISKYDKEQYTRYKLYYGAKRIGTIEKYLEIKYNNVSEWNYLKNNYKVVKHRYFAIEQGLLTPLVDVEDYIKLKIEANKELLGIKLKDNTIVKKLSYHFIDRIIGSIEQKRSGVAIETIKDILENSDNIVPSYNGSYRIIGNNAIISYNKEGVLIQTNPRSVNK